MHGHGLCKRLGTCLVLELRAFCIMSLQHVPMFEYAGCVWAWMRYVPRYVPSISCLCCGHIYV